MNLVARTLREPHKAKVYIYIYIYRTIQHCNMPMHYYGDTQVAVYKFRCRAYVFVLNILLFKHMLISLCEFRMLSCYILLGLGNRVQVLLCCS